MLIFGQLKLHAYKWLSTACAYAHISTSSSVYIYQSDSFRRSVQLLATMQSDMWLRVLCIKLFGVLCVKLCGLHAICCKVRALHNGAIQCICMQSPMPVTLTCASPPFRSCLCISSLDPKEAYLGQTLFLEFSASGNL